MSKHILIIDDEEGIRDSFQLALKDREYSVAVAASGEEGVQKANNERPDLVFLDLKMIGINGIETLRRLRRSYPDIIIYIVTAFHEEYMHQIEKAQQEGFEFEICHKPLNIKQIQELANSVLSEEQKITNYTLKLYIAGQTVSAVHAIENIKRIFDEQLKYTYELKIIDVLKEPNLAQNDNIIATPTLVLVHPSRNRMVIGDLSCAEKVFEGLGLSLKDK